MRLLGPITIFVLFCMETAQAQVENWHFGSAAGISFQGGGISTIFSGMNATEGVASFSDSAGRTILYTNGEDIFNRNNVAMPGGPLGGGSSARQSAVVVPQPGDDNILYVFTADENEDGGNNGIQVATVNLSGDGGLGEVVQKDQILISPSNENITAVGYCDNNLFWIAAGVRTQSQALMAFKVDSAGVDIFGVRSEFNGIIEYNRFSKFSPQGNKFVISTRSSFTAPYRITLFDFDPTSGEFSSPIILGLTGLGLEGEFWSFEFSSDGNVLVAVQNSTSAQRSLIKAYNLALPTNAEIAASEKVILDEEILMGSPQLAPDGNIYIPRISSRELLAVSNTDDFENLVIVRDAIELRPQTLALFGLPNFATSYFDPDPITVTADAGDDVEVCLGDIVDIGNPPENGLTYSWEPPDFLSDPTISNPQFTITDANVPTSVFQYILTTSNGFCFATDTVNVALFNQKAAPEILGSASVCPNVEEVDYEVINPQPGFTYNWNAEGGTVVSGQGSDAVKITWGDSREDASVTVESTSPQGCTSDQGSLTVTIKVELATPTPAGLENICSNLREGNLYSVINTNGSEYTWGIEGGVIDGGQGSNEVSVTWTTLGQGRIWVRERSVTITDVCFGTSDTLSVEIFDDPAAVNMEFVSVDFDDDSRINLQWNFEAEDRILEPTIIQRMAAGTGFWEEVATLTKDLRSFDDINLTTDEIIYEYRVIAENQCQQQLTSNEHNSILVSSNVNENNIALNWNAYDDWPEGVENYEIWRKIDEQSEYELLRTITADSRRDTLPSLAGFQHYYKVKANSNDGINISWSNELELLFDHQVSIPNVITPNDDDFNENFVIGNIELFPENELVVYNRHGREVFSTSNYQNQWSPSDLPVGVYYYSLLLKRGDVTVSGWLQLLR